LREGLRFSDGSPLTTKDVVFTLNAMYDKRTSSPIFSSSMLVDGKPIESKIVDELNMQLVFPEQVASVDNYLDNLGVLPSHVLEEELNTGKLAEAWNVNANPQTIVTSGPFTVESAVPGERVTLKRNEHYWKRDEKGTQLPYIDRLVLEAVGDPNQALVRLNQGTVDIIDRIRPTDYVSLRNGEGPAKAVDLGPGLGVDHIWFNLNAAEGKPQNDPVKYQWFSDRRFRQAVSHAIDRKTIAGTTLQSLATPLHGFVSPANKTWAAPDLPNAEYDLQRAESLLKEAGFTKSGTPDAPELLDPKGNRVEFSLLVQAENEPRKLMAAVVQEDLAKLGIRMQVVPVEVQAITERWSKTFDYDAILMGLSVSGVEPTTYANFLLSSASVHQWHPSQKTPATDWEAEIDRLFAEQARETDVQKRADIFNRIQHIMAEESPVIPLAARHIVSAANARIGNYSPAAIFPYSLWNADELFVRQ
jgi:peptide/nickel transport system substrate-binding protein